MNLRRTGFTVFIAAACGILAFQNCGQNFSTESLSSSSQGSSSGSGSSGGGATSSSGATGLNVIQLTWTASAAGQPISYAIEQSTDGLNFLAQQTVAGSSTSATVSGLGKMKYYFRVSAVNAVGQTRSQTLTVDLSH